MLDIMVKLLVMILNVFKVKNSILLFKIFKSKYDNIVSIYLVFFVLGIIINFYIK